MLGKKEDSASRRQAFRLRERERENKQLLPCQSNSFVRATKTKTNSVSEKKKAIQQIRKKFASLHTQSICFRNFLSPSSHLFFSVNKIKFLSRPVYQLFFFSSTHSHHAEYVNFFLPSFSSQVNNHRNVVTCECY